MEQKSSKSTSSTNSLQTITSTNSAIASMQKNTRQLMIAENFVLVWLDSNINQSKADFKHSLTELGRIVHTIDIFTDVNRCIDFLHEIKDEKVFMIVSGSLGQSIISNIHDMAQLDSIYIFCDNKMKHGEWSKAWRKVKGVFTKIDQICATLKQDTQICDRDSTSFSVTNEDMNRLEPSFMYTQLMKEILLELDYDENAKNELTRFCRNFYLKNEEQLKIIDEF